MTKSKILIIGAGRIGLALYNQFQKIGHEVKVWDKDPARRKNGETFENLAKTAEIIFITAPSSANRAIAKELKPYLFKKQIIISLAKGLEETTGKNMSQILKEEVGKKATYGFMAGPMLAHEIERFEQTVAEIALSNKKAWLKINEIFLGTCIKVNYNTDLVGLTWCAVLKNIYAVGFGISDELGHGTNIKSCLTLNIISEIQKLLKTLGGKKETFFSPAGLGDLLTTGWNSHSFNYNTGREMAKAPRAELASEGSRSLKCLYGKMGSKMKNYPIMNGLKEMILSKKDHRAVFSHLLKNISCKI